MNPEESKKKVIAIFKHRKPMVFESITDCVNYFRDIHHPLPNAKAVTRRIENNETWSYSDMINNGVNRVYRIEEVHFDWFTDKPVTEEDPDGEWRPRLNEQDQH